MEAGTQGLLAGGVFVLVFAAVVTLLAITWRRAMHGPGNALLMHRMFEREGVRPVSFVGDANAHALAAAARRCVLCASAEECRAYLDSGDRSGFEKLCPNAQVIGARRADPERP